MTTATASKLTFCPICLTCIGCDDKTKTILDETFHVECVDGHNADIDAREKEAGVFEGMDVRSDDNACDWEM